MVRRSTAETTRMATDHVTARELSSDTRRQHKIHAGEFWRGQRTTHIQGLRNPEDAEESPYWRENADASTQNKKNFYAFFNEHDRRRLTRFLNTFPEMEEFWEECKNAWQ